MNNYKIKSEKEMEKLLYKYKKVYLCDLNVDTRFLKDLIGQQKTNPEILFLVSDLEIGGYLNTLYITPEMYNDFIYLYYTYEFSDCFHIISNNKQYPCLFNYVRQGILTEEEMIEALLYQ